MASTSGSRPKTGKLTAMQSKMHKLGLQAPNRTLSQTELMTQGGFVISPTVQECVNSLLRLSLITIFQDGKGALSFRFSTRDEASVAGAMESDEKLVFDQIKDAGNQGIWTRTLKDKTGLHQTSLTRLLKVMEGKKQIKVVKSVKTPTRKIYMLAHITPSVDMTGGPWFTDNELDTEFVDSLKSVIEAYLRNHSIPDVLFRTLYDVETTPYLPTVREVTQHLADKGVSSIELADEHIESLLDLMIYDGLVEKILVTELKGKNGKLRVQDPDNADGPTGDGNDRNDQKRKKKKALMSDSDGSDSSSAAKPARKKARQEKGKGQKVAESDSDDSDRMSEQSAASDSSEDERADRRKGITKEKRNRAKHASRYNMIATGASYVYRLIKPYKPVLGWTDMPCGNCPSESFCAEAPRPLGPHHAGPSMYTSKGASRKMVGARVMQGIGMIGGAGAAIGVASERWGKTRVVGGGVAPVNPKDCAYFKQWLDFSMEDDEDDKDDEDDD